MKSKLITGLLLVVAVIHLIPVSGVIGTAQLNKLYGLAINGSDLEILMRHRAVMFGILGTFFAFAAFKPRYQPLAFLMAFATISSFLFLAYQVGGYQAAINKVVLADWVAGACLVVAVVLYYGGTRANHN